MCQRSCREWVLHYLRYWQYIFLFQGQIYNLVYIYIFFFFSKKNSDPSFCPHTPHAYNSNSWCNICNEFKFIGIIMLQRGMALCIFMKKGNIQIIIVRVETSLTDSVLVQSSNIGALAKVLWFVCNCVPFFQKVGNVTWTNISFWN